MRFRTATRAALVVAGLAYAPAAHAVLMYNSTTHQYGSLTISSGGVSVLVTVTGCSINSPGNNCTNSEIVQNPNASYLGIVVQAPTASTGNFADYPNDITFSLTFTASHPISGVTLDATGLDPFSSVGGTLYVPGQPQISASPGLPDVQTFAGLTTFSETLDAQPFSSGDYITNATENFIAEPEPGAFGLFVLALLTTGIAKYRRRLAASDPKSCHI